MSGLPGSTMTNPRPEKVAVVDEVRTHFSSASGAILTEYRGLKVDELAALRRSVREAGGEYRIYKNTLVRLAVHDLELDLEEFLTGPTAIAFVEGDAVTVAKAIRDFAKNNPALIIKGGLLGNSVLNAADAGALADVAPRETLLARFAGGLAAPLQQMAGLLQALPRNLAFGLKALIEEKGGTVITAAESPAEASPAAESPAEASAEAPTTEAPTEVAGEAPTADGVPSGPTPAESPSETETTEPPTA